MIRPRYFSFAFGSSQRRESSAATSKPMLWRVARVARARVAESDDQGRPRRGRGARGVRALAPAEQPQGLLLGVAVGVAGVVAALGVALRGLLALGRLALLALFADQLGLLLELGLGLLLDARRVEGGDRDLVGVDVLAERELDALGRRSAR